MGSKENFGENEILKKTGETDLSVISELETIHSSSPSAKRDSSSDRETVEEQEVEVISKNGIKINTDCFGFAKNQQNGQLEAIKRFKIITENLMTVEVITFMATITSIAVPNAYGVSEDILLGHDSLVGYFYSNSTPLGAMSNFTSSNSGSNPDLSKIIWTPHLNESILTLTYIFNGDVNGQKNSILFACTFEVKNDNSLTISTTAKSALPFYYNISSNLNFNLSGHSAKFIYDQMIALNCHAYVVQDKQSDGNATEEHSVDVKNTPFDLRTSIDFGEAMARNNYTGFNQNFQITKYGQQQLAFVCRVFDPLSGRSLEIYTDQLFAKLRTLPDWADSTESLAELKERFQRMVTVEEVGDVDKSIDLHENIEKRVEYFGKKGARYTRHGAFSLHLLRFPCFEDCGHPSDLEINYAHTTIYKFGISHDNLADGVSDNVRF